MVSLTSFRTGLDVIITLKRPQDYLLSYAGLKNARKLTLRDGTIFRGKEWYFMYPIFSVMREYGNINELPKSEKDLVIVDLGAHIGSFSILTAKKFPLAKIYSYEPNLENFTYLDKNIKSNHLQKRVSAIQKGVSSKKGKLVFYGDCVSCSSKRMDLAGKNGGDKSPPKQVVNTITLEDIFKTNHLTKIDFLKMDCEGSEFDILYSSSDQTLRKIRLISLEYHEWNGREINEIAGRLESCGFAITRLSKGPAKGQGIIHARRL